MRPCFAFKAAASDDAPASLAILDEIGFWGVQARDFRDQLNAITAKVVNVDIDSPGGDVFAGLAIYNMLHASGKTINVKVVGVAASAASVIAMAGDSIEMPENTFMMVHNPWSVAIGNADELRETADVLDKIGTSLQGIYVSRSGQTPEKVAELLSKDTWLTAAEAKELGLATVVSENVKANAKFDLARAELPAHVQAALYAKTAPVPTPVPAPAADPIAEQVVALAKAAGLEEHASAFALQCTSIDAAQKRFGEAREIVALCAIAKRPSDAGTAIRANKSVAEVRAALVKAQAEADEHTSNVRRTEQPPAAAAGTKTTDEVYAERNAPRQKAGRR